MAQLRFQEVKVDCGGEARNELGLRTHIQFNPMVEFPSFDGIDPKGWIEKYSIYFTFC